ncbi:MAG: hypothetical protein GY853_09650, partial [PVC group bacterium]|nr:hypothetical protein [PVC group bacterium]
TYGNSKDHRPDLKQVVLSMVTTGPAGIPVFMEALDGNNSDKTSFHDTIKKVNDFQQQMQDTPSFIWVADSALYTSDKLLLLNNLSIFKNYHKYNQINILRVIHSLIFMQVIVL